LLFFVNIKAMERERRGFDANTKRLLDRLERDIAELRAYLFGPAPDGPTESELDNEFDGTDWARRQRPEWEPRGRLMNLVEQEGGQVSFARWKELGDACGYEDGRGMNGFFAGNPPVVTRGGDDVVLTERGHSAAAYWRRRYGGRARGRGA
jgi:hypothetical protein